MQGHHCGNVVHRDFHAKVLDAAHGAIVVEHAHLPVLDAEEVDDFSWLEVAAGVFGLNAIEININNKLIGNVIRSVAQTNRIPAVAFGHLAVERCPLDGFKVGSLLVVVFLAEQVRLVLEGFK